MIDEGATEQATPFGPARGDVLPDVLHGSPAATLVVDVSDGVVHVISPAAVDLLGRPGAWALRHWLADLTASPHRRTDTASLRTWTEPAGTDGELSAVSVTCLPITYRGRDCIMFVLLELVTGVARPADPTDSGSEELSDVTCAAFTLDVLGQVESWNASAQRVTGFTAQDVVGCDTSVFYPATARLAGDPAQVLTRAYRSGEHRTEGWRLRGDGTPMWAEVTTVALRDGNGRLAAFGVMVRDLTDRRRLRGVVSPGHRPALGRHASLIPAQRHP